MLGAIQANAVTLRFVTLLGMRFLRALLGDCMRLLQLLHPWATEACRSGEPGLVRGLLQGVQADMQAPSRRAALSRHFDPRGGSGGGGSGGSRRSGGDSDQPSADRGGGRHRRGRGRGGAGQQGGQHQRADRQDGGSTRKSKEPSPDPPPRGTSRQSQPSTPTPTLPQGRTQTTTTSDACAASTPPVTSTPALHPVLVALARPKRPQRPPTASSTRLPGRTDISPAFVDWAYPAPDPSHEWAGTTAPSVEDFIQRKDDHQRTRECPGEFVEAPAATWDRERLHLKVHDDPLAFTPRKYFDKVPR